MALNPCVQQILCALDGAILSSLSAIITTARAAFEAEKLVLTAQLVPLDIALAPIEVAQTLANTALSTITAAGNLVPVALIRGCTDLGDFNLGLSVSTDRIAAEINALLDEARRILSVKDELVALIAQIDIILAQFKDIDTVLSDCAAGA